MKTKWHNKVLAALVFAAAALAVPATASAFCGFYVGGADAKMYNDATQVVLMRDGTRTIQSMQNRYEGPLDDFAMVVPVPQVLMEDNVNTLDKAIFDKIDTLTSPRLVEYWEQDPCAPDYYEDDFLSPSAAGGDADGASNNGNAGNVTVEASFAVGEYSIVVLSTNEGTALETWLEDNNYNIPDGAAPYFEPYIQSSMYFFVAKVDPSKVTYENGKAVLSPLRFHYDSPDFQLPVRLGMINSAGTQDLMVYILGRNQRYEVANMPNVTIPTNIEVVDDVRNDFPGFYQALFTRTMNENPGHAVTEYSWPAGGCDPCPGPVTLQPEDLATLGVDVTSTPDDYWSWIVTRLHVQYQKDEVGEDLVFRAADPIVGGREWLNEDGELEEGATPSDWNNFQARYIIRHRWEGAVECADPVFERWGGDPNSSDPYNPGVSASPSPNTAGGDVFASDNSSKPVEQLVTEDIPEIGVIAGTYPDAGPKSEPGCSSANAGSTIGGAGLFALLGLVGFGWRRRRR